MPTSHVHSSAAVLEHPSRLLETILNALCNPLQYSTQSRPQFEESSLFSCRCHRRRDIATFCPGIRDLLSAKKAIRTVILVGLADHITSCSRIDVDDADNIERVKILPKGSSLFDRLNTRLTLDKVNESSMSLARVLRICPLWIMACWAPPHLSHTHGHRLLA